MATNLFTQPSFYIAKYIYCVYKCLCSLRRRACASPKNLLSTFIFTVGRCKKLFVYVSQICNGYYSTRSEIYIYICIYIATFKFTILTLVWMCSCCSTYTIIYISWKYLLNYKCMCWHAYVTLFTKWLVQCELLYACISRVMHSENRLTINETIHIEPYYCNI